MAKSIMIQGTGSSVGKSLLTAGLCRLLKQDGYSIAPFKSQNMALNSYITLEGKEMGRAQVVQAEAAGIEPHVSMNPILLKPTSDRKTQVIINGDVYCNMSAIEYHQFKPGLRKTVSEAYEQLADGKDIIVIEGAGSPAEINLRENDIVNMGMAEISDSPVILVGDIDKGGVFASLAGTMQLLTEAERSRVKGVIINKFRGDLDILKPGIRMLEDIIKIPVLGVVPYVRLNIDDEDGFLAESFSPSAKTHADIDIAVIKLPHISNFTDFNSLEKVTGVKVRYIESMRDIKNPDVIILPGSKNTIGDLMYIKNSGIEGEIIKLHRKGIPVIGICGGYQMLGNEISDPLHTESDIERIPGMGLLNASTVFSKKKTTSQVEAVITYGQGLFEGLEGMNVKGYEIHMGLTRHSDGCIPCLKIKTTEKHTADFPGGAVNIEGNIFGTYMHGIFDNTEFTTCLINNLRKRKGLEGIADTPIDYKQNKELEYDRLALLLRSNLNMQKIYEIIGV